MILSILPQSSTAYDELYLSLQPEIAAAAMHKGEEALYLCWKALRALLVSQDEGSDISAHAIRHLIEVLLGNNAKYSYDLFDKGKGKYWTSTRTKGSQWCASLASEVDVLERLEPAPVIAQSLIVRIGDVRGASPTRSWNAWRALMTAIVGQRHDPEVSVNVPQIAVRTRQSLRTVQRHLKDVRVFGLDRLWRRETKQLATTLRQNRRAEDSLKRPNIAA